MVKEVSAVSYIYLKFSIVFEVLNILSISMNAGHQFTCHNMVKFSTEHKSSMILGMHLYTYLCEFS